MESGATTGILLIIVFIGLLLLLWPWMSLLQLLGVTLIYWPCTLARFI